MTTIDDRRLPRPSPIEKDGPVPSDLDFDKAEFRPYLDGLDITEAEKDAFLDLMWDITLNFVEMRVPSETWGKIIGSILDDPSSAPDNIE